jgi:hypothetical protein
MTDDKDPHTIPSTAHEAQLRSMVKEFEQEFPWSSQACAWALELREALAQVVSASEDDWWHFMGTDFKATCVRLGLVSAESPDYSERVSKGDDHA